MIKTRGKFFVGISPKKILRFLRIPIPQESHNKATLIKARKSQAAPRSNSRQSREIHVNLHLA